MEHEKTAQDMTKSNSTKPSGNFPQKEVSVETRPVEESFSSPTPVKKRESLRIKNKEAPQIKIQEDLAELPQEYEALLGLFEGMSTSLRLLSLTKKAPTFQNVVSQVEILTGSKLLPSHLAQMKHILADAIQIDKVLIHDEKTMCMKPYMVIALVLDVVKDHKEVSVYLALKKLFSSRLREFYIAHQEGCDVPEAALPMSLNQKSITTRTYPISENLSSPSAMEKEVNLSNFPRFKRFFSQKGDVEMETNNISSPANEEISEEIEPKSLSGSSSTVVMGESTPVKPLMGSDNVHVGTPVLSTPMRPILPSSSVLTCEDEDKMSGSKYGTQPTSSAKKALDFYGLGGEDSSSSSRKQSSVCLSDCVVLIHNIFQSVNFRPITKEELVHKVIMHNLEIDDRRVVEMQIEDLEKLVPDWFSKKSTIGGDLIYSVKKVLDLNSICERVNVV